LRERHEDIKLLFNYFIKEMSPKFNRYINDVDPTVIRCLENYDWPGNIRELQNVVERILLMSEKGHITIEHLPQEIVNAAIGHSRERWEWEPSTIASNSSRSLLSRNMRKLNALEQEQERIIRALDDNAGNISKASIELGISRSTLYRKMKNYNIKN
jgi:DNA-binding NtrC family response regulator